MFAFVLDDFSDIHDQASLPRNRTFPVNFLYDVRINRLQQTDSADRCSRR